jgi:hypothetical protein
MHLSSVGGDWKLLIDKMAAAGHGRRHGWCGKRFAEITSDQ